MKLNPTLLGEIASCVTILRENGLAIFPGETGWCIACSIRNNDVISKMNNESQLSEFSILLDAPGSLNKFITDIPNPLWDLVEFSNRPLTLLLSPVVNLPESVRSGDQEAAFRIVKDDFSLSLLQRLGGPLYSAILSPGLRPVSGGKFTILNTPAYMVNLRAGTFHDNGVVIRLSSGGRIEFIRK